MKLCPKETLKRLYFLTYQKPIKKRYQKNHDIFSFKSASKHVKVASVFHRNCIQKIYRNKVDFSPIEVMSEKVCRSDVGFSTIEIITKKYVKMI